MGGLVLVLLSVGLVPFAIIWCLVLLVSNLFVRPSVTNHSPEQARSIDAASIMILNWNGRDLLKRMLPTVRAATHHHGGDHEIIVIDNGSNDGSVEFVEQEFPEVTIIRHPENRKFVRGYNDAFAAANKDIVVLLNNDMLVDKEFLGPLLDGFSDPATFAVSSQIFLADPDAPRVETGLTGGLIHGGVLKLRHDNIPSHITDHLPVLWAGGGSSAFDRQRLMALGGFDPLYDPFYFEDTGLSYEAWKRGWNVLLAPNSKVTHEHQASSDRLSSNYVARIKRRNQHLFAWRHLTSTAHAISTSLLLPFNAPRLALTNKTGNLWSCALTEAAALLMTLPRLPAVLSARIRNGRMAVRSDTEVFQLAHSRHKYERTLGTKPGKRLRILMMSGRTPKRGVDGSWGLFELIRLLGKSHDVTLFSLVDRNENPKYIEALRPLVKRLETHILERDIGDLDLHHQIPHRIRQSYTAPNLKGHLTTLLRTERFDVAQVDYFEMAAMVRNHIEGILVVHVVHEPLMRFLGMQRIDGIVPQCERWLKHAQAVNFETRIYPRFTRVSCLSDEDERYLKQWLPNLRTAINPIGVNVDSIQPCQPSSGYTMLSIGYFGHPPNVDATFWFVQRILPLVQSEIPEAQLRLIGGGATEEIMALAANPGVTIVGKVAELLDEMENCALTLAPSREGGGLRTKVLESLAFGRTMVVTPVAASGILVEDGRHLRIANGEKGFAAAIVELLRDTKLRHSMELKARDLIMRHYTSSTMADRAEAIFREAIE
jgi:GT2 family glycosyltransferase/glycosyltransferase involved in cell wall biosynthesis